MRSSDDEGLPRSHLALVPEASRQALGPGLCIDLCVENHLVSFQARACRRRSRDPGHWSPKAGTLCVPASTLRGASCIGDRRCRGYGTTVMAHVKCAPARSAGSRSRVAMERGGGRSADRPSFRFLAAAVFRGLPARASRSPRGLSRLGDLDQGRRAGGVGACAEGSGG